MEDAGDTEKLRYFLFFEKQFNWKVNNKSNASTEHRVKGEVRVINRGYC